VRSFLAADLPPGVKEELAELTEGLKRALPAYRWVKPSQMHLTLHFLGELPAWQIAKIEASFGESLPIGGPILLTLKGIGAFPSLMRARTLWVGLDGDLKRLGELYELTTGHLSDSGIEAETRSFKPHLTLGRAKGRGRPPNVKKAVEGYADFGGTSFQIDRVILFESDLRPGGPIYTPRVRFNIV